jgi:RNA polymerase sigma-70 factor, ECF subfamily
VQLVLRRLPMLYRAPLVLRYVSGFSTNEVAELLELPLGTVLSQLHRGRQHLEHQMWVYAEECGFVDGRPTRPRTPDGRSERSGRSSDG